MPLYFLGFLAMLGAALLLYVAALATWGFTRKAPPCFIHGRAADGLRAVHLALVWIAFGVGWLLYFNVYRIHTDMAAVGDVAFQAFARGYTTRLPVVVLPFGAGALAAVLVLWSSPGRFSRRAAWGIATLWLLSVASTPWAAGAQGDMHDQGYSDAAFQQLQLAHLFRTLCVSAAAIWTLMEDRRSRP